MIPIINWQHVSTMSHSITCGPINHNTISAVPTFCTFFVKCPLKFPFFNREMISAMMEF